MWCCVWLVYFINTRTNHFAIEVGAWYGGATHVGAQSLLVARLQVMEDTEEGAGWHFCDSLSEGVASRLTTFFGLRCWSQSSFSDGKLEGKSLSAPLHSGKKKSNLKIYVTDHFLRL